MRVRVRERMYGDGVVARGAAVRARVIGCVRLEPAIGEDEKVAELAAAVVESVGQLF
jgi:hypothetical protein